MLIVGELRDQKMANEIIGSLNTQHSIQAELHYNQEHDIYTITVNDESQFKLAQDFFRVKLGFKKPVEIDQQWIKIKSIPRGEYTSIMIMISVVLYLLSFSNFGTSIFNSLYIGKVDSSVFYEITHGQIWRLLTPIFLHMSFMHILFNMLWFKDLGNLIEYSFGKMFLIKFILISALTSNLLQYMVSGPQFGGMSGVLYAMLGFLWIYKKCNPEFEYSIPKFDLGMMIGWFFMCLTGVLGPIANTAHGIGLVTGMIFALLLKFKWEKLRIKFFSLSIFFLIFTLLVEGYKLSGRFYLLLWLQ